MGRGGPLGPPLPNICAKYLANLSPNPGSRFPFSRGNPHLIRGQMPFFFYFHAFFCPFEAIGPHPTGQFLDRTIPYLPALRYFPP